MLLQQRGIERQQLSQAQQGTVFHIGIVMVELRQELLVKQEERKQTHCIIAKIDLKKGLLTCEIGIESLH